MPKWRPVVWLVALSWLLASCAGVPSVVAVREVGIATADGGHLDASVYGSGDQGVILAHGGRYDRRSWRPQAETLARNGWRVLAFDFRGWGASRAGSAGPDAVHEDVLAAIAWLRADGATRISVIGASFGGGAAAEAATRLPSGAIDALVLLAHSPIAHPERMTGRKLFLLATEDYSGEARIPRRPALRAQFEAAPAPKQWREFDGEAHAQALLATPQGAAVLAEILEFLAAD